MMKQEVRAQKMRAQVSMELIIMISIAFVTMLVMTVILVQRQQSLSLQSQQEMLNNVVKLLHEEILMASIVSDGYERTFNLPSKLGYKDYEIFILNNSTLVARISELEASMVSFSVSGQPIKDANIITKKDGIIKIN